MAQPARKADDMDSDTTKCPEHILSQHSCVGPTKIRILVVYLFWSYLHVMFFTLKGLRLLTMKTERWLVGGCAFSGEDIWSCIKTQAQVTSFPVQREAVLQVSLLSVSPCHPPQQKKRGGEMATRSNGVLVQTPNPMINDPGGKKKKKEGVGL